MKKEYTIEDLEDLINVWSWKNSENRKNWPIIVDFLCEIDPKIKERYTLKEQHRKSRRKKYIKELNFYVNL